MRVSHIQLACKHCNFQSLMFLSTFLVGGIFKTSIRNWCSWITFWLSDFQSRRRKEFFTLPFWMNLCFVGYECSQIWLRQRRHAIETERVIYLRLRLNSRARSGMVNKCSAVKYLHISSASGIRCLFGNVTRFQNVWKTFQIRFPGTVWNRCFGCYCFLLKFYVNCAK